MTPYWYTYIVNHTADFRKGKYYRPIAIGDGPNYMQHHVPDPGSTLVGGWQWGQAL